MRDIIWKHLNPQAQATVLVNSLMLYKAQLQKQIQQPMQIDAKTIAIYQKKQIEVHEWHAKARHRLQERELQLDRARRKLEDAKAQAESMEDAVKGLELVEAANAAVTGALHDRDDVFTDIKKADAEKAKFAAAVKVFKDKDAQEKARLKTKLQQCEKVLKCSPEVLVACELLDRNTKLVNADLKVTLDVTAIGEKVIESSEAIIALNGSAAPVNGKADAKAHIHEDDQRKVLFQQLDAEGRRIFIFNHVTKYFDSMSKNFKQAQAAEEKAKYNYDARIKTVVELEAKAHDKDQDCRSALVILNERLDTLLTRQAQEAADNGKSSRGTDLSVENARAQRNKVETERAAALRDIPELQKERIQLHEALKNTKAEVLKQQSPDIEICIELLAKLSGSTQCLGDFEDKIKILTVLDENLKFGLFDPVIWGQHVVEQYKQVRKVAPKAVPPKAVVVSAAAAAFDAKEERRDTKASSPSASPAKGAPVSVAVATTPSADVADVKSLGKPPAKMSDAEIAASCMHSALFVGAVALFITENADSVKKVITPLGYKP